ncbi:hypothetical protein BV22DRAFT_1132720 [Leucogyrophana mollusca]|uniref:Uncharacterized protein n=1 Tax=Leucogyrophana mollusca TaxID=85980 RepID=A0ACB8B6K0_9AGAM|nr:hypothetical protein BV22DRAFT_1132720 [Leucogyrophana mollusca]
MLLKRAFAALLVATAAVAAPTANSAKSDNCQKQLAVPTKYGYVFEGFATADCGYSGPTLTNTFEETIKAGGKGKCHTFSSALSGKTDGHTHEMKSFVYRTSKSHPYLLVFYMGDNCDGEQMSVSDRGSIPDTGFLVKAGVWKPFRSMRVHN